MRRSLALLALTAPLLVVSPARADRVGHAPIRGPQVFDSIHTEFELPGGPWAQAVGASGKPSYGGYAYDTTMASGNTCRIFVRVRATATKVYPQVGRRAVRLRPRPVDPPDVLLHFDEHGRHGDVRWWAGSTAGQDAAAGAVEPMPARMRSARRRWIVYRITIAGQASFSDGVSVADEAACHERARTTGKRTAIRIGRTITAASGPPVSQAPFAGPLP